MNKPKVSIVIPVYNTEKFVEQTLRSILTQTLREIEIIVIDDGSTDGSAAIVRHLMAEDDRIRFLAQTNKGPSEARNTGIGLAQGEFIYFMDSDDLLDEDTLEVCYGRCQADSLDFVIFDGVNFGSTSTTTSWHDYRRAKYFSAPFYNGSDMLRQLLDRRCFRASPCLSLIRLSFLKELGLRFYPGIVHEDELFTPQLYIGALRVGAIERSFFHRRLREGSIMTVLFSTRNLEGYMTVLGELKRFAATHDRACRRSVRRLSRNILINVLEKTWQMPAATRWELATTVVRHYPRSITLKPMLKLLFKKSLKR